MKDLRLSNFIALTLLGVATIPSVASHLEAWRMAGRLSRLQNQRASSGAIPLVSPAAPDPALATSIDAPVGVLASWQTVGGCGAGSGGGSSIGLKWIGHNVRGGLFNVQEQVSYTKVGQAAAYPEYDFFSNTLITTDITDKWNVGVNLPVIYKYLVDPTHIGGSGVAPVDYSNSGLGDVNLLCTRRLGRINDLLLTGIVGLPTGVYDARFTKDGTPLNQSQQIGFGRVTTSLTLDQLFDQVWGLAVVGGNASYRGGQNSIHNYRAPSATAYGYVGYFLGPFVPALGLSVTGFYAHDRDQDATMRTPLASFAANLSLEWSSDWIALLIAASIPYGYDGIRTDEAGQPRSPRGFLPWTASLGIAISPF
jgi:hypothetical protein